jgi:predicted HicB family RNase H-like nuclease
MLLHKGFIGKIEFDHHHSILRGEVLNAMDLLEFDGRSAEEIKQNFIKCVDDYCLLNNERNTKDSIPFIGNYSISLSADKQNCVMKAARESGSSMEIWLNRRINDHLGEYFKEDDVA